MSLFSRGKNNIVCGKCGELEGEWASESAIDPSQVTWPVIALL